MFSFGSTRLARGVFALLVVACLSMVLLFTGCTTDDDDDGGSLNGIWKSLHDDYIINTANKTMEYENHWKGEIANAPDYSAGSGVIIIKITWYWEVIYDQTTWEVISEGPTTAYNGKYCAVYWKDLKSKSVKMGDAYDPSTWEHAMFNSLSDAQTNFTLDKTGEYIGTWGTYTK